VLITGSQGGIGQALCAGFRAAGYFVVGTDLPAQGAGCDAYLAADLAVFARDAEARGRFARALERLRAGRPLKTLVNNAAVQTLAGAQDLTGEVLRETLDVNVVAPALLTALLLPELAAQRGSVVNIGSIHARLTKPGFVAYATSKAALSGLTRALAVDIGDRVRVNAIEPAAMATGMLVEGFADNPEGLTRLARFHPLGRIGEPAEVADLAVFLASDRAGFLNGAVVALDGGIGSRLHDPA
jgi:NAD(P)-dependent dehydrogenase (short-subunit alcohol dehydrogenase family)